MARILNKESENKALKSGLVVALGAGAVLAGQAVQSQNTQVAHAKAKSAKKSTGSTKKSTGSTKKATTSKKKSTGSTKKTTTSKKKPYSKTDKQQMENAYGNHTSINRGGAHQVDKNGAGKTTSTTDRTKGDDGNTRYTITNKNGARNLNNGKTTESWIGKYSDGSQALNGNWDGKKKKAAKGKKYAAFKDANGKVYEFSDAEGAGTVTDSTGQKWAYDAAAGHMQKVSSTPSTSTSNTTSTPAPSTSTPSTSTPASTPTQTSNKTKTPAPKTGTTTKTPAPTKTDNKKQTGKQTFNFVDKSNNKVVGTSNVSGEVGKDVPVSLKVPNGYKLVEGQKVPTSANIKSKDTPINILVEKDTNPNRKDGKQTVEFVDKDTGKVVSTPVVLNGKVGDKLTPDLKVPDGYKLADGEKIPTSVDIKDTDNPIKIKVTKDDDKKQDGQQTYRYMYDGKPIGTAVVKGKVGDKVPVSLKIPKGYKLAPGQKLPTEADIKATDKPIDIKLVKDDGNGTGTADSGVGKSNNNGNNGNNGSGNTGNGGSGNTGNNGSADAGDSALPQTGNSKSTAGVLAGSSMVATMAALGIAYSVKKRKA